MINYKDVATAV